jgi:glycosyltransferase involved in cell wall biosynthesis
MRVGYVTIYDPSDRLKWSGLGHAIMQALIRQGMDVKAVGPLATVYSRLDRLKRSCYKRLLRQRYEYARKSRPCREYARQVSEKLFGWEHDIVFSVGSLPVSRLQCNQPIVIWADTTFACYIEHYGLVQTLCAESIRAGHATENLAYQRASMLIFASEWAAASAMADYRVDPAKVKVVPFGANFLNTPIRQDALNAVASRPSDRCELITIGVDWVRKGMPRAIALAGLLNERGLPTRITVVGCRPPTGTVVPEFVRVEGFIDKRMADGERRISDLLLSSHFHVLFSTAEAFGVAFAEANAHAVPNISSDVGGTRTAVVNNRGGQRFDLNAPLSRVADYVQSLLKDKNAYDALGSRARMEFEERLNWEVCGAKVRDYLDGLVSARTDRGPLF